tara:strand:+ start:3171 stop:3344 length:174 start_codon:yes stop_codon:yes gene_type:complete
MIDPSCLNELPRHLKSMLIPPLSMSNNLHVIGLILMMQLITSNARRTFDPVPQADPY